MAYYKIKYKDKVYINPPLLKAAYGIGSAGLTKLLATGKRKHIMLLDDIIIESSDEEINANDFNFLRTKIQHQFVNENLETFSKPNEDIKSLVGIIVKPEVTPEILSFEGYSFVRMRDLSLEGLAQATKYFYSERMPVLFVCGSKYVAINTLLKITDNPVILTIPN